MTLNPQGKAWRFIEDAMGRLNNQPLCDAWRAWADNPDRGEMNLAVGMAVRAALQQEADRLSAVAMDDAADDDTRSDAVNDHGFIQAILSDLARAGY